MGLFIMCRIDDDSKYALMSEYKILTIKQTKTMILTLFDANQEYSSLAPFSIQQIIKQASKI
ncbi:unnamed protein product [Paramecium sonneborni]|uniref:Uncharacterized protein n=1 Tax=Paramecium sonneborni TaxID=65129 RepID=A0A8S1KAF4_9CILI|nr:unnamed protein product [Paramecium sonneborni]